MRSRSRVLPILSPFTALIRSPRWKPSRCAGVPTRHVEDDDALRRHRAQFVRQRRREIARPWRPGTATAWRSPSRRAACPARSARRSAAGYFLAATHDLHLRLAAERLGGEAVVESVGIIDRLTCRCRQSGRRCAARLSLPDCSPRRTRPARRPVASAPMLSAISGVTACSFAPSQGRLHAAAAAERGRDHDAHHIHRDGEADADRAAGA